jgi:hypothetical protein
VNKLLNMKVILWALVLIFLTNQSSYKYSAWHKLLNMQKNGAVSKVNKKFISHLTRAQCTPSPVATAPVSYALITILQHVHNSH